MRKLKNEELGRLSIEEFKEKEKINVALVLDNVRSLNNVGSAFRSGDAFLIQKIYLCGITGKPPNRELHRTALGAEDSVAWEHYEDTLEVIRVLKKRNWIIVALEQADESIYLDQMSYQPGKNYAFVFGNEVFGVKEEVIQEIDFCVEIPQFGYKHSLNIAVSIGIVLWDFHLKTAEK